MVDADYCVIDATWFIYELKSKLQVMKQSLIKVEDALYTVRILQSEYPASMLASLLQSRQQQQQQQHGSQQDVAIVAD